MLIFSVYASPYYITHPTYFPSKNNSYISFDTSLLPLSFSILYRDSSTKWHFNNYWLTTTTDMTVTQWFSNDWFNYTVSGSSIQQIYNGTKPNKVYFNNIEQTEGDTWSYAGGTITVTTSGTDVAIFWGETAEPPTPPIDENGAGGFYILTVYTTANGLPCSAKVTIENWESQVSDLFGNAYFTLPYGDYTVKATYAGQTQNKTVGLYSDMILPFDFELSSSPSNPEPFIENPQALIGLIILGIFLLFAFIWIKKG